MSKSQSPSVKKKAFSCPRCGALADQHWYEMRAVLRSGREEYERLPFIATPEFVDTVRKHMATLETDDKDKRLLETYKRMAVGDIFIHDEESKYSYDVPNLHLSQCHSCKDVSLWLYDRVIYPNFEFEIEPNPDLTQEIKVDFNEAREILAISPRAAAALLRLCIQKLCVQLGLPGKNINDDIAVLVSRGVSPKVQKSLDIVRVIGNEAVHPGKMDLRDDRGTAEALFRLVNLIAQETISNERELDSLYEKLPQEKRVAIEKRDKS